MAAAMSWPKVDRRQPKSRRSSSARSFPFLALLMEWFLYMKVSECRHFDFTPASSSPPRCRLWSR